MMASEDMALRPCGSSWTYCDENCTECHKNNLTYTTSTEAGK
jgi:hypothetical protein